MAADWVGVENALQALVKAATGFDNRHCYWADPNVSRPQDGPFATLELVDRQAVGLVPETEQIDHGDGAPGQEVELSAKQTIDCGLRVQVFAPPARGTKPGTPRGAASASTIASRLRLAASLPSNLDRLDAVGVSVYDFGNVLDVPAVVAADFEARAVLDLRFFVVDSVSEFTGYIGTVQVTDTQAGKTETVDLDTDSLPEDFPLTF